MQQIARAVTQAFNNLPRPHRVMLGSLSVLTLAVAVWRPYIYHPESAPIVRTIELEKSEIRSLLPEASEPIDQAPQEEEAIPQDELDEKADSDAGGHEYVVSTGDTLSSILNQYGKRPQHNAMGSRQIIKCQSDRAGYLLHVFTSSLISFQAARILVG